MFNSRGIPMKFSVGLEILNNLKVVIEIKNSVE